MRNSLCLLCLLFLSTTIPAQALWERIVGTGAAPGMGASACAIGDINGDGHPELVAVASAAGQPSTSKVYVYSMKYRQLLRTSTVLGSARVVSCGDWDNDGIDDYAVAATGSGTGESNVGNLTVLSAISGSVIANFSNGIIGSRFGTAVAVLPDRDLDGRCEFLVSAPAATTSGPSYGAVHVISSATGLALASHFGSASGFFLGSILDVVGDVNGDGVVDYAFSSIDLSLSTLISVHSGATDSLLYQLPGPNISSVKPLGDINNDGFDDFVTSAPSYPSGANPVGRVVVHSGFDGSVLHSRSGASGAPSGSRAGNIIGTAGDYNGDGTPDYIFSTDGGPTSTINVASGATHQVIGGLRTVTAIGSTQPTVGGFVTATPDFNGDGVPDYLLGLPIAGSSVGECVLIFDKTPYTETYSSSNPALPEALSLAHVQTVTPSGGIGGPSKGG